MTFGVHEHGKSKKTRYFWILSSLGLFFFVENSQKLRNRSGKLPNREAQRLPKGGQGRQKGEKNH